MDTVEPLRHLSVFNPQEFGDARIDVIGAGATGSKIAIELAKLGVQNLHVWDDDNVEAHNIANQAFGNDDIGTPKVEALAEMVEKLTGLEITAHNEKVTEEGLTSGDQELGKVVFLLTDTMSSRKDIFEAGLHFHISTELVIETRMDADNYQVFTFNPNDLNHVDEWQATLFDDDEAAEETTACGGSVSVGPTSSMLSGHAVWQFLRWNRLQEDPEYHDPLQNAIIVGVRPPIMINKDWDA